MNIEAHLHTRVKPYAHTLIIATLALSEPHAELGHCRRHFPAAAPRHKGGTIEEAGVGEGEGDGEGNVLAAVSLPSVSPVARSSLVQTCR